VGASYAGYGATRAKWPTLLVTKSLVKGSKGLWTSPQVDASTLTGPTIPMIRPPKGKVVLNTPPMEVPHNLDDVGGEADKDVLKQGLQEVRPLWCNRVSARDRMESRCYDLVNKVDIYWESTEEVACVNLSLLGP
jgi:hypothetical protein